MRCAQIEPNTGCRQGANRHGGSVSITREAPSSALDQTHNLAAQLGANCACEAGEAVRVAVERGNIIVPVKLAYLSNRIFASIG